MQAEPLKPELAALEAALASLTPQAPRLDRDRLMFQAGQAAPRRRAGAWLWPCATAASLALAAVLALRGPAEVHDSPPPAIAARDLSQSPYLELRRLVLAHGVDALPEPAASPSTAEPPLRVLDSRRVEAWLDLPRSG